MNKARIEEESKSFEAKYREIISENPLKSCYWAYLQAEAEHFAKKGNRKYKSYQCFRTIVSRRAKRIKQKKSFQRLLTHKVNS